MSNSTLDRPKTSIRTDARRPPAALPVPAAEGSYVDRDGVRRTPRQVGSYVGSTAAVVGGYTDRDGVRWSGARGSYTRVDA